MSAQVITVSDDLSIRNDLGFNIIGEMKGNLLLFRDRTARFEVQAFNDKMRATWTKELLLDKRRPQIVDVVADKANDAAGNGNTAATRLSVNNDETKPSVLEVGVVQVSNTYKLGDVLRIFVQYDEPVTVVGTPQLTLETGATDRTINYVETSSSTVYFDYTIQAGDVTSDLDIVSANALALNSGTIKDAAGNDASIVLPVGAVLGSLSFGKNIVVDGIVPTITSVSVPANGTYVPGNVLEFTAQASENIRYFNLDHGTNHFYLELTIGSTKRQAVLIRNNYSEASTLVFRYTIQSGDVDSDGITVGPIQLHSNGSLTDVAGNNLNTTLSFDRIYKKTLNILRCL